MGTADKRKGSAPFRGRQGEPEAARQPDARASLTGWLWYGATEPSFSSRNDLVEVGLRLRYDRRARRRPDAGAKTPEEDRWNARNVACSIPAMPSAATAGSTSRRRR